MTQAGRVDATEIEQVLGRRLRPPVESSTRRGTERPFEEVAVEDAVDLAVLAPDQRRGERTRAGGASELNRRREARHVGPFVHFRPMEVSSGKLRAPRALPPARARGPRVQPRAIDVQPVL